MREREVVDLVAVDDELSAQDEHPVLQAVAIAMRLVLKVMDAVTAQDGDMPGTGVGKMHDTGRIDGLNEPVAVDLGEPGATRNLAPGDRREAHAVVQ